MLTVSRLVVHCWFDKCYDSVLVSIDEFLFCLSWVVSSSDGIVLGSVLDSIGYGGYVFIA